LPFVFDDMDTITAIETQKRRSNRMSIYVNGRFAAGVDEEVVAALGLCVGQRIDENRLAQMLRAETVRRARQVALNLLSFRPRTRNELSRRLILKGYPEDVTDEVLAALAGAGLVNDEQFTKDWVADRLQSKPMGSVRIAWELRQKGVAQEVVQQALESIDSETEYELALGLARKRLQRLGVEASDEERRRLASFLRRRGFSWDVTNRVIDELAPADG